MIYLALTSPGGAIDWPSAEPQGLTLALLNSLGASSLDLRRRGLAEALATLHKIQQDNASRGFRLVCDCRRGAILKVSRQDPSIPGSSLQISTERGMHSPSCEIRVLQFEQRHQSKTQSKPVDLARLLVDILYEAGCAQYPWRPERSTEMLARWAHERREDAVDGITPILAADSRGIDPGQICVATEGWDNLASTLQSHLDAGERNDGRRRAYWIGRIRDVRGATIETGLGQVLQVDHSVESLGLSLDMWPYQIGVIEFFQGEDGLVTAHRASVQSVFGASRWWPIDSLLERNTLDGWIAAMRAQSISSGQQWRMKRVGFGKTAGIELLDADRWVKGRVNPSALIYTWLANASTFQWGWPWRSVSVPVPGKYSDLLEAATQSEATVMNCDAGEPI